ncbi:MAG: hypothetical protein EXR81_01205, partial [Gammaproteobacteria bacterium]|nr:hypothetical protein [Gammaproteobacteria bacterium]
VDPSKLILGIPAYVRLESGVNASTAPLSNAPGLYAKFTGAPAGEFGDNTGVYDYKCAMSFFGSKFNIAPLPTAFCKPTTIPGASDFVNNLYLRKNSSDQVVGLAAYSNTGSMFFSFDAVGDLSIDTLTPKVNYIKSEKLAGAMFWELSGDLNPTDYPVAQYQQYSLIYNAHKQLNS